MPFFPALEQLTGPACLQPGRGRAALPPVTALGGQELRTRCVNRNTGLRLRWASTAEDQKGEAGSLRVAQGKDKCPEMLSPRAAGRVGWLFPELGC